MEIPSQLKFSSDDTKSLQKIKKLLAEDLKNRDHAKAPLDPSILSCKAYADTSTSESSTSSSDSSVSVQATLDLHANGDTEIWVQYDRTQLNLNDKIILQKHIQYAQKLIKEQFPFIGGLFSTLCKKSAIIFMMVLSK